MVDEVNDLRSWVEKGLLCLLPVVLTTLVRFWRQPSGSRRDTANWVKIKVPQLFVLVFQDFNTDSELNYVVFHQRGIVPLWGSNQAPPMGLPF